MVSLTPKDLNAETVAQLCVEFWKLSNATKKAIERLPESESRRLKGQLNFSERQLAMLVDQLGLKLIDFEEEVFHAGLATSADNIGDFPDGTDLVVSKTLEPTVMADMKVVRLGRVLVEPAKSEKE
ncbi:MULTISPECIES: hypothetical protein [Marivita]|uniref:Uncharacterized protein n=1 Tax=Marivita cryptomonadis TaxID=505252 RepID=A0A9Q2NST2_9RHOB|nr:MULTISPECIES: hypothetical protein [Marivita]MCR9167202.1 hypothetical protein [Paracoccaceae bacterium]MBM2320515.1 hypothetical protein [Marivita cryptomonadis]MBM2330095.1 hypothetical protein [Marivita cryptomonadis]MBM2339682.1 hypothetical protein [Marivita cryptomonadis]MBM2344341.1 hypothetical protein [Marivita cryptomonadis]